jgi:hypothetical protein
LELVLYFPGKYQVYLVTQPINPSIPVTKTLALRRLVWRSLPPSAIYHCNIEVSTFGKVEAGYVSHDQPPSHQQHALEV